VDGVKESKFGHNFLVRVMGMTKTTKTALLEAEGNVPVNMSIFVADVSNTIIQVNVHSPGTYNNEAGRQLYHMMSTYVKQLTAGKVERKVIMIYNGFVKTGNKQYNVIQLGPRSSVYDVTDVEDRQVNKCYYHDFSNVVAHFPVESKSVSARVKAFVARFGAFRA
jgi:hypothetical protein